MIEDKWEQEKDRELKDKMNQEIQQMHALKSQLDQQIQKQRQEQAQLLISQ